MKMGITIIEVNQLDHTFRAHHRDMRSSQDIDGTFFVKTDEDGDEYIEIGKVNVDLLGNGGETSFYDVNFDEDFEQSLSSEIANYIWGKQN